MNKEQLIPIKELETEVKIALLTKWYRDQFDTPLFQGEENEITPETIYHRLNWLDQISRKTTGGQEKHLPRLNRMYYYNIVKWPRERRQIRFNHLFKKEVAA